MRSTALTGMAESDVPIASLQRIAGHSSIEVTAKHYLTVKPEGHDGTIKALPLLDRDVRDNSNERRTDGMECELCVNSGVGEATGGA